MERRGPAGGASGGAGGAPHTGPGRSPGPARRAWRLPSRAVAPGLGLAGAAVVLVVLVWSLGAPFRASGPGLSLAWATAEPWATEGGSTLVEMRLVVDNDGRQHTQSTSILWGPAFASRFTLISSDPPAWRVRIDERGWGVLDTAGLLPSRHLRAFLDA